MSLDSQEIRRSKKAAQPLKNCQVLILLASSFPGTRKDELNMPVFAAHQNLAWPQLHEDSIPEIAFWRAMSKVQLKHLS